jgi:hypothetical protein
MSDVRNSSACYKVGNYHPILMQFDTQTKTEKVSSINTEVEVWVNFQDGHRCCLGNSNACYEMGNCRPILIKFGAQTQTDMLNLKFVKAEVYAIFQDGRCRHFGKSS